MERKFKIWDKVTEAWMNEDAITINGKGKVFLFGVDYPQNVNFEILYFSGLTDKNSEDVFLGDKLQCYKDDKKIGAIEIVEFKKGSFWLRYRDIPISQWLEDNGDYGTDIAVIGDIYEPIKQNIYEP